MDVIFSLLLITVILVLVGMGAIYGYQMAEKRGKGIQFVIIYIVVCIIAVLYIVGERGYCGGAASAAYC